MKLKILILLLCVAGLAVIVSVRLLWIAPSPAFVRPLITPANNLPAITARLAPPASSVEKPAEESHAASNLNWQQIESSDWSEFVARLRSSGMPEDYIRAIALVDLRKQLKGSARHYWQSDSSLARLRRNVTEVQSEQAIQSFLAGLGLPPDESPDSAGETLGFLPESLRKTLTAATTGSDARIAELRLRNSSGAWEQDDLDALNAAKSERTRTARQALTPEQFLKWEAAQGEGVAERLQKLPGYEFQSEQDFLAVYAIERDVDQRVQSANADLGALSTEREQRLRALLGEDRFRSYQRSQDTAFAGDLDFARRYQQPTALAESLFDLRKAVMEREHQILASASSPEVGEVQVQREFAACRQTIQAQLGSMFPAYLDGPGGWLNR